MRDCKDFVKDLILVKVGCMVLVVFLYGIVDNVICGVDGNMINVMDEICFIFLLLRCFFLFGKLKMYIFNVCRGGEFYCNLLGFYFKC